MNGSHASSPNSAEVEAAILQLQERHPRWVSVRTVATTLQQRPVYAVTVNDPQVDDDTKQHALVLASQHGNEESSRMIALALLQWLTTDEAKPIRQAQKIVVMPNINPDGAEADSYHNAQDIQLNGDHPLTGAVSPEGQAIEALAHELQPELVADMHGRGMAGCSYDMVMSTWTRPYTEDGRIVQAIIEEMAAAGEAEGVPHVVHPLTWPGWYGDLTATECTRTLPFMYRQFKSLCVLTETSESNTATRSAEVRTRVGVARMRAMLGWGQRRHPSLYYSGYPVSPVTNMFTRGIVATGATAAKRRASRVAIWRNADHFTSFSGDIPELLNRKSVRCVYDGPELPDGAGFQIRCGGHWPIVKVERNGHMLEASEVDGFVTWQDGCSTFVVVNQPVLSPGAYDIQVTLA